MISLIGALTSVGVFIGFGADLCVLVGFYLELSVCGVLAFTVCLILSLVILVFLMVVCSVMFFGVV